MRYSLYRDDRYRRNPPVGPWWSAQGRIRSDGGAGAHFEDFEIPRFSAPVPSRPSARTGTFPSTSPLTSSSRFVKRFHPFENMTAQLHDCFQEVFPNSIVFHDCGIRDQEWFEALD